MPPAKTSKSRAKTRAEPYPASKPDETTIDSTTPDKENEAPKGNASPASESSKKKDAGKAGEKKGGGKGSKKDSNTKADASLPDSYLDIDLEEKKGEVPCYENARGLFLLQWFLLIRCRLQPYAAS
jgi:hypothetical protein